MLKAYDVLLMSEVSASLAAKSGSSEPFRYECAHCGEEVRLAAATSSLVVPHFRHHSGNSDKECEFYLGQHTALSTDARSRKSKTDIAEFYFDHHTMMFYLGLRYSHEEIVHFEKLSTVLELRTSTKENAFCSIRIDHKGFASHVQRMIPLDSFSQTYFLSNSVDMTFREHNVFRNSGNCSPTLFKVLTGDTGNRAKLVRSGVIYTNVTYFAAYHNPAKWGFPPDVLFSKEIAVERTVQFETMNRKFLGKYLTISVKTAHIDRLLSSWGYRLESSEVLTLLWPPAILSNDVLQIHSTSAYLLSSFELHAHGNINIHSDGIKRITDNITKVSVSPRTKVLKKNVDLMIEYSSNKLLETSKPSISYTYAGYFQIMDKNFYIFNRSGVLPLIKGAFVHMTPNTEVRHYSYGYLDGVVVPHKLTKLSDSSLLYDIISYYKRTDLFDLNDFESLVLSHTALQYINSCKETGRINSTVKRFIEEGLI
jgi:hypothetical protein